MRDEDEFLRDLNPPARNWEGLVVVAALVAVVVVLIVLI